MRRTIQTGLFAIVLSTSAAFAAEPDLRCTQADHVMTERLRTLTEREDAAAAVRRAMTQMTYARLDCKHGRTERGLQTYRESAATLAAPDIRTVAAR